MTDRLALDRVIRAGPVAEIRLARARGSAPREAGAWMAVTAAAQWGTVGGGAVEHMGVEAARAMLAEGRDEAEVELPLGPAIGQCCGGHVRLAIRRADPAALSARLVAEIEARPEVVLIGAGHVGLALARALALLPVQVSLVDGRAALLEDVPDGVEPVLAALPEAAVRAAGPGAAFVILTHDHALDFQVTREALLRGDAAYVGLIGSATKRATFARWLAREEGAAAAGLIGRLTCPIGAGGPPDKRPAVIAARVAAELMVHLAAPARAMVANP